MADTYRHHIAIDERQNGPCAIRPIVLEERFRVRSNVVIANDLRIENNTAPSSFESPVELDILATGNVLIPVTDPFEYLAPIAAPKNSVHLNAA